MTNTNNHDFDVIIIGAGHNGLCAGATLARKGKKILVLERSKVLGGMARTEELIPGVRISRIAHLIYNLNEQVAKELEIGAGQGSFQLKKIPTVSLALNKKHVIIENGVPSFSNGEKHPDSESYALLYQKLSRYGKLLSKLATISPPMANGASFNLNSLKELFKLAKLGINLKFLGTKDLREFLRIIFSNAYDVILDEIQDGPLAGALAADAVRGSWSGPRSPGSLFSLIYRLSNGQDAAIPVNGMGSLAGTLINSVEHKNMEVRTGIEIHRVLIVNDAVAGVILRDGTTITARSVLSSIGAKKSMLLAGVNHFDIETVKRVNNIRSRGSTAKVNLVLKEPFKIDGLTDKQAAGRLLIAPSVEAVEAAFNSLKYGNVSPNPIIEVVIPSFTDKTLCSNGNHVLSAIMQFVPYDLRAGWGKEERDKLSQLLIDTMEKYIPGFKSLVIHTDVLSPHDIEQITGAPGGHWHHQEISFDQLLTTRPAVGISKYSFGIKGYYLCGSSAHPGGDVMGAAGRNSALQLIADGVFNDKQ